MALTTDIAGLLIELKVKV